MHPEQRTAPDAGSRSAALILLTIARIVQADVTGRVLYDPSGLRR